MIRLQLIALFILCAFGNAATAEEAGGLTVSGGVGFGLFDDDRQVDNDRLYWLGAGYRFSNRWAVELGYISGELNGTNASTEIDSDQWRVDGLYHFRESDYLVPYLSFGIGNGTFSYPTAEVDEGLYNIGVGAKIFVTDSLAFRADVKNFRGEDSSANDVVVLLGLHYAMGRGSGVGRAVTTADESPLPADRDGDGVPDERDACPGTAAAAEDIDPRGCPVDSDGDGVPNYLDECQNTTDRRARIDERGCYVTLEEAVSVELNVEFDVDSAEIRPSHLQEIRKVAEFMEEYPGTQVTIEGHTDDTGDEDYNQDLSERRARAIADVLIEDFGIDPDRVEAVGYGESRPLSDNATDAGRQQNRRVVAVIETTVERTQPQE